jgi:flagellar biosynthesis/type III secretory pathway protein FliH
MSSSFEFPELTAPTAPGQVEVDPEAEAREAAAAAREEGYAAGLADGRAEIAAARAALGEAAAALAAEREAVAEQAERAAAELGLAIAEKVLGAALEARPELVLEVTRGALRRLAEPSESVLLVNPDDLAAVSAALEQLAGELGAPLKARAERRVDRGGCVVRSQAGEIDARIGEQLERARAVVLAELGG